ncbi:hypothetical protein Cgig2_001947 [Carnegiea gigantea]|uniref:Uncharacterized protein n=1 Tax=Carnegiea gigantea TaxID=171969 RepID=A0A9Q1QAR6_9CARY|nr:hypothetical protein Cgig2_001947 [Carnegiea gigantea]
MVFGGKDALRFASPHNNPLVVEMKIASVIVRRILIDTGNFVDIITWDCLKKLAHPGRDIVPLVNPILGFEGQEVNPTGMICLPVHFGDKTKFKSLEVDFLVIDVPMAYNPNKNKNETNTNKTKGGKEKTRGRGYTSGSPPSSCSSPLEAPASASRGLVASSPAPSPLGCGPPRQPAHAHPHSKGRPRSNCHLKTRWHNLAEIPEGVEAALLVALLLSLDRIICDLLQLTLHPFHLGLTDVQCCWYRETSPSNRLGGILSLRSCQVLGLYYVLDERELGGRVCLDEVGRGPRSKWGGAAGCVGRGSHSFRRSQVLLPARGTFPR